MNNLEAAKNIIASNYPFDDNAFKTGLASAGLDSEAPFAPGKSFDLAIAQVILFLITSADVSEGGYSVKLDRNALVKTRIALLSKWDSAIPAGATLQDRTYKW